MGSVVTPQTYIEVTEVSEQCRSRRSIAVQSEVFPDLLLWRHWASKHNDPDIMKPGGSMTFPSLLLFLTHTLYLHTHTHTHLSPHTPVFTGSPAACFMLTHSTDDEILPQPQVMDRVPVSVSTQLTTSWTHQNSSCKHSGAPLDPPTVVQVLKSFLKFGQNKTLCFEYL